MTAVHFLNVDLEVASRTELRWLVEEFGADAVNLYCGPARGHFLATFEAPAGHRDPDSLIGHFCTLVENMPGAARRAWDAAFQRVFDIGYEAGVSPTSHQSDLRSDTIAAAARIGASLRITIYPPGPADPAAADPDTLT